LRIPLIFDFQGSLTSEMIDHHFLRPDGLFYRPMRWLEEIINRLPGAIITSSQHAKDLLCDEFGCDGRRIYMIPDCVNAEFFKPDYDEAECAALKAQWGIPQDRKVVVYLGLLAEYQGIGLLLEGVARLLAEAGEESLGVRIGLCHIRATTEDTDLYPLSRGWPIGCWGNHCLTDPATLDSRPVLF